MKTVGLLGGMSWESTQTYYRAINEGVKQQLGGLHSARLVLWSVDFAEIEALQMAGDWEQAGQLLAAAAQKTERAGADFLVICTNTMHKVAPQIAAAIQIPILHIADATADVLLSDGVKRVGLLGTRFTMEQDFYRERLQSRGIHVLVPDARQRQQIHEIIYNELCLGIVSHASRDSYLAIMAQLHDEGAEGIILGCTEISMLVNQQHTPIALYDTTAIHAQQAVKWALA